MDASTYRLHPLTGNLAGSWAVDATANQSMKFRFEDQYITEDNLLGYH